MQTRSLFKRKRTAAVVSLSLAFSLALCLAFAGTAQAATLTPDSGILVIGLPTFFSADGLTASTDHKVNVTVGGTETIVIAVVTSNADGELSFSLTLTRAGATTVEVIENVTVKCTGTFDVQDIMAMTMQFVVFIMGFIVLFAVIGMVIGFVKFRR